MTTREVLIKPYYWKYEDTEDDTLLIHVGGRDENNKTVHLIIEGFTPFVYLELPTKIKWNASKHKTLFEFFKKIMKSKGPINMLACKKRFPKYLEEHEFLCFTFPTQTACRSFSDRCNTRTGLFIDGLGMFRNGELRVHEHNIDPVIKFTAARKLPLASWIKVKETIHEEEAELDVAERKYTTANVDLYAKWNDVSEHKPEKMIVVNNKYISFDIECYSKNHNSKLPDPTFPENKVFQIACTIGLFGTPGYKTTLLTLGNPMEIKDVKVVRYLTEKELLMAFRGVILKEDPDFFVGYNTIKFDWMYLLKRAELLGIYDKFIQITRCVGRKSHIIEAKWESSAYGEQQFKYPDPLGRTNIDVLLDVERNYRLPSYSLKSVGEFFKLEEQKEDVSARQLFMIVDLTDTLTPVVSELPDGTIPKDKRVEIKREVQRILQMRRCTGDVRVWRDELMAAKTGKQFKEGVRKGLTISGKYCARDTVVPVLLCNKLNLVIAMEEISNCMYVPMSYIHTRGQQIKVLAQILRKTMFSNIVIPFNKKGQKGEKYQGATVIEANKGDYNNVVTYDFESLYPTVLIALNICYTTILPQNDPTPDSECNLVPISEHVGCPHDPLKRKKKKADILCKECVYRFKKVKFKPDGTRENEGILPEIERELLIGRKATKKEMAKQEAVLKMVTGLATPDDIQYYTSLGWKLYKKGEMDQKQIDILKIIISVLNAQQLVKKVSANSVYGALGADTGYLPLKEGAASITAMGRALIMKCIKYILETNQGDENGNGKAALVYGDTDSSMLTFKGKNIADSFELGEKISKKVSHFLKSYLCGFDENYEIKCPSEKKMYRIDRYPRNKISELSDDLKIHIYQYDYNPINLNFENLYKRYILFTKKRYVAHAVNKKGEIINTIKKGIVLVRRDNCQYLKDTYKKMIDAVLDNRSENEVMGILYNRVSDLFTRQIPDANLIIYMGIKTIINYAKTGTDEYGKEGFIDAEKNVFEPRNALDDKLVYPNIPQVLLTLKMMKRGDDVPPNTRLEFLYLEDDEAEHQGEKAEDYTFYRENKSNLKLKPDYLHYIEKQLTNPVTELLDVKYPRPIVPYEKMDDAVERCIEGADFMVRSTVNQIKRYSRTVPVTNGTTYNYKGMAAKVQYILDAAGKWTANHDKPNEVINPTKNAELIKACKRWKAFNIINQLHAHYGTRKRTQRRPTQTGEKLRISVANQPTQAVLIKDIPEKPKKGEKIHRKGEIIKLLAIREADVQTAIKKKKYVYTVEFPDTTKMEIERSKFTTFYYKDSTIMKDILIARGTYKAVINQINLLFDPFLRLTKEVKEFVVEDAVEDS
jgi:DNA polymerase delta subunit 1